MEMFFKVITSGKRSNGKTAWIHPGGVLAAVIDATRLENSADFISELTCQWDGHDQLSAVAAVAIAETSASQGTEKLRLTVFQREPGHVVVQSIGASNVIRLDRSATLVPQTSRLNLNASEYFLASATGFGAEFKGIGAQTLENSRSEDDLAALGKRVSGCDDWAMLAFPFESTMSYVNSNWKYNPFAGSQEERDHEKRGLSRVADCLFRDPTFDGFKIVGGQYFQGVHSSNMPDGILVSPWGLFVLELKDHWGQITLPENSQNTKMSRVRGGRVEPLDGKNPIAQLMGLLRSNFQRFDWGTPLQKAARAYGVVVFTNPNVNVQTIDYESKTRPLPRDLGDVIVCTPESMAAAIKAKMQRFVPQQPNSGPHQSTLGSKLANVTGRPLPNVLPSIISQKEIEKIVMHLTRSLPVGVSTTALRQHGRFTYRPIALESESNSFYKVYLGNVQGKDRMVWIKEYPLTSMDRGDGLESEIDRLRRELTASQDLPVSQHIQRALDAWDEPGSLFVALDHIAGEKLDDWLRNTNPSREQRLRLLLDIAKTLSILAKEEVVHRALTPSNLRVDEKGEHIIINFELCKLQSSATIAQNARALLDTHYQSPEVLVAGRQVSPSADVYSFGKLACFVLSADASLPYASPAEQQKKMAKAGFWASVSTHCGFDPDEENSMSSILAFDPSRRPVGSKLVEVVEKWR